MNEMIERSRYGNRVLIRLLDIATKLLALPFAAAFIAIDWAVAQCWGRK